MPESARNGRIKIIKKFETRKLRKEWLLKIAVLAFVYFASAKLGLMIAFEKTNASPIWPPTGVALAAVLLFGYRVWPGITIGAFLANFVTFLANGFPAATSIPVSVSIATGNTLEAVIGAFLVFRFIGSPDPMGRFPDIFKFLFFIGVFAAAVSATIGVTSVCIGGMSAWNNFGYLWMTWWEGDIVGALLLVPAFLVWADKEWLYWKARRWTEAGFLYALVTIGALLAFWVPGDIASGYTYSLEYIAIPIILLATFRLGKHGATTSTLIVAAIAVSQTLKGFGPFVLESPNESLLFLQIYILVIAITAMSMAGLLEERKNAEKALHKREHYFRSMLHNIHEDILVIDQDWRIKDVNNMFLSTSGHKKEEVVGRFCYEVLHGLKGPCDIQGQKCPVREVFRTGKPHNTRHEHKRSDGSKFWVDIIFSPLKDENGNISHVIETVRDVTEHMELQESLKQRTYDLGERIKELNCLYGISKLAEKYDTSLEEIIEGIVNLIPAGCQYPEITCARVLLEDQEFRTGNYKETVWKQTCDISVPHRVIGRVDVCYIKEMPEKDEGPFLKEERDLIEAISERLGRIIEQKWSQDELRESENKYRTVLENLPQKIFHKDKNSVYISCNENYAKELRIKPEDIKGKTDYDFYSKELAEKHSKDDKLIIELGNSKESEEQYNIDGREMWIEKVKTPIRNEMGDITGILGIYWDITERKLIEARVRKETERATLLLELYLQAPKLSEKELYNYVLNKAVDLTGSAIGFFHLVSDDQKDIILTAWNSEALQNCSASYDTHYSIEKAGNWVDCVRQKKPIIYNEFPDSPNQRGLPEGHMPLKRFMSIPVMEDDKIRYIFGVGNKLMRYDEGDVIQIQLIANELSKIMKQRIADKALKESEERYRALFKHNPIETIIVDNNAKILMYNLAKETSGSRLPKVGDVMYKDYAGGHKVNMFEELIECLKSGKPKEFPELKYKEQFLHIRISPYTGGAIITSIDLTERKKLQEQLRQSQKMEAVGTLTGGIAHDFNNLLTAIIGNAEVALMTVSKDDSLREDIEEIKAAGNKAAALTSQLLAFSRKQVIQPIILDINEVVKGLEKMFARLIREDVEIKMILHPGPCNVKADPTQIEQVIINLLINARDAMPHGGMLTIETRIAELDEAYFHGHAVEGYPGHFVMLSMTDTGIGMDKVTQSRIFEPFFTTKEIGEGTGLGLATVYGIVKQNDGFIWVYSEPGHGTTFKTYLPEVVEIVKTVQNREASIEKLRSSETVLVVEDDDMVLNLIRKSLKDHGYQILEAQNGQQALQLVEDHEGAIDIVVTDVVMPKMSGRELARHLLELRPEIKVLYMSGYSGNAISRHGILENGAEFIQKPLTPKSLLTKIREVLDGK